MEILNINLGASETKSFRKAGSYVEILASVGPVGVMLYAPNSGVCNSIVGGQSGLFLSADFDAFDLVNQSGAAQQVQLLVCDRGEAGGSRRQPGNVVVIDNVATNCTLSSTNATAVGFTAQTIVAPAANVNGLIVRMSMLEVQRGVGGTANMRLVACPVAPVSMNPANPCIILNSAFSAADGVVTASSIFDQMRRIPVGWGLYVLNSNATVAAVNGWATVNYEVQ